MRPRETAAIQVEYVYGYLWTHGCGLDGSLPFLTKIVLGCTKGGSFEYIIRTVLDFITF